MNEDDLRTWRGLVRPEEVEGLGVSGSRTLEWAILVHEEFFTDAWLERAADMRSIPFLTLSLWPVTGPGPVLRLIERACQLELVREHWGNLRQQAFQNSPPEATTHLRLILESAGWVLRRGHRVEIEPELGTRRKPDLLAHISTERVLIELTAQSKDRLMREVQRYGAAVEDMRVALAAEHGVVVTVVSENVLSAGDLAMWFEALRPVAQRVAASRESEQVAWGQNTATVHPPGSVPTRLHDGPTLNGDMWPRLGTRIREKASQTEGGPPTWIRVEVDPTLFALTSLAQLDATARLRAVAGNVALTLRDQPHVLGVLLGTKHGPGPGLDIRVLLPDAEPSPRSGLL